MLDSCRYWVRKGGWLGLLLWVLILPAPSAQAHGGTLVASGTSADGQYGWMLSVLPYPVVTGPVSLSLLVFDTKSSALLNTVTGELYVAAPDTPRPCCEPGVHQGPFPLLLEPFQYGDYIAYLPIDQIGPWEVQFRLTIADDPLTVVAPFEVVGEGGLDLAAIQTAVDELTATTRQQTLATAQAVSPLPLATVTASQVVQAPSPLLSPLATPTLPAPTVLAPSSGPPTEGIDLRLVGGGIGVIVVGIGLLWWRIRKKD